MNRKNKAVNGSNVFCIVISLFSFLFSLPFTYFLFLILKSETNWDDGPEIILIAFYLQLFVSLGCLSVFLVLLLSGKSRRNRLLTETAECMKRLSEGDYSARIEISRNYDPDGIAGAFNSMAEKIAALDTMRTDFMCNVSHDMKTPMTVINGYVSNILNGSISKAEEEKYLELVKKEIMRLSVLVGKQLYVSRLDSGDFQFVYTNFDICECARIAIISLIDKIETKKQELEFDCRDTDGNECENLYVYGDSEAISVVVSNIIDNAVKFTPEGGKIAIRAKEFNGTVTFSVYNEGEGIRDEDKDFVFDRFFKCDRSRGLEKDSFGLGLYISKKIIEAHGSKILLRSKQGKNCEFSFSLQASDKSRLEHRKV